MVLMMSGNLVARVGHAHGDLSGKCRWAREERRKKIQREETDYCKASMRERDSFKRTQYASIPAATWYMRIAEGMLISAEWRCFVVVETC
jgi:hypothetical protein